MLSDAASCRIVERLRELERQPTAIAAFMSLIQSGELERTDVRLFVRAVTMRVVSERDEAACWTTFRVGWLEPTRGWEMYVFGFRIMDCDIQSFRAPGMVLGPRFRMEFENFLAPSELMACAVTICPEFYELSIRWEGDVEADLARIETLARIMPRILPTAPRESADPAPNRGPGSGWFWRSMRSRQGTSGRIPCASSPPTLDNRGPAADVDADVPVLAPPSKRLPTWGRR